jgi:hypothetical protein
MKIQPRSGSLDVVAKREKQAVWRSTLKREPHCWRIQGPGAVCAILPLQNAIYGRPAASISIAELGQRGNVEHVRPIDSAMTLGVRSSRRSIWQRSHPRSVAKRRRTVRIYSQPKAAAPERAATPLISE